ncbi:hypothetical protein, partial [Escherichia coli]|uniref:hypothetical protein n=1 Tax=Escherichia coli TaxID=562 RepID=UPI0021D12D09
RKRASKRWKPSVHSYRRVKPSLLYTNPGPREKRQHHIFFRKQKTVSDFTSSPVGKDFCKRASSKKRKPRHILYDVYTPPG